SRTVQVLDEDIIARELAKSSNIGDLLGAQVPGFGAPTFLDIDRTQTLRGREPLYLFDGVPLGFNGGGGFQRSPLVKFDSGTVGRVEVLYGPTAIYGAGATGGVIQFFSVDAPPDEALEVNLRQQVTVYPGAEDVFDSDSVSWLSSVRLAGTLDRFDYVAAASYDAQNGVIDGNGDLANPVFYGFSDDTSYYLKLGYEPTDEQRLTTFFNYVDRDFQDTAFNTEITDDGFAIGVQGDKADRVVYGGDNAPSDEKYTFSVAYDHANLFGNQVRLQYYDREDDITGKLVRILPFGSVSANNTPLNYQQSSKDTTTGYRFQLGRGFGDRFNVLVGADYEEQEREADAVVYDLGTLDMPNRVVVEPVVTGLFAYPFTLETWGVFAQLEFDVNDTLRLSGGIRHEDAKYDIGSGLRLFDPEQLVRPGGSGQDDGQAWNVGFTYDLLDSLTVYGSYAEGFEIPSLSQVAFLIPPDEVLESNDAVTPQIVDNYELGVRGFYQTLTYTVSLFYSESDFGQLFLYDPVTRIGEYQRAPEENYGFELSAAWQVTDPFIVEATFSWAEGSFDPDGDGPEGNVAQSGLDIQPWKAVINASYDVNGWLSLNARALAVGDRDAAFEDAVDLWEAEGYEVFDVGADLQLGPGLLSVQLTNLFDETYLTPASQSYVNNIAFASRVAGAPGRALTFVYDITF
ncbi:MAG: TonB-dependent receptor, partial [Pseudomonadota bacterium]